MARAVIVGEPPVEITLRNSARARRLSLRVSGLDGRVTLSVPRGVGRAEAMAFAEEKSGWIRRQRAACPEPVRPGLGGSILFEGRPVEIVAGAGRCAALRGGRLTVPPRPDRVAARIRAFLMLAARERLHERSHHHAGRIGHRVAGISLRDTRSRWGSCSHKGALMYSWRLIMAPRDVLDYVAAHEVAHLAEMNHGPAFWQGVQQPCPGYEVPRQWLRANAGLLHRYRFDD